MERYGSCLIIINSDNDSDNNTHSKPVNRYDSNKNQQGTFKEDEMGVNVLREVTFMQYFVVSNLP